MRLNKYNIIFIGLLFSHATILLFLVDTYSISGKEVGIFFSTDTNVLSLLTHFSTFLFGH